MEGMWRGMWRGYMEAGGGYVGDVEEMCRGCGGGCVGGYGGKASSHLLSQGEAKPRGRGAFFLNQGVGGSVKNFN